MKIFDRFPLLVFSDFFVKPSSEYTLKATSVEATNVRSSARLVPETERTKALKEFMVKQALFESF